MRILNLRSENIKGIKVIDITPEGNMVIISGKNGAGKTSALDSIWMAAKWKAGSKETPMPIREGAKKAEITLTLCEDLTKEQKEQGIKSKVLFIVNRKFTENGNTYLKVTNGEGLVFETPQKLLDGFIGFLSIDPGVFTRMNDKEQRDLLIRITGFDVTAIETKIVEIREKRRLQGQKVKLLSGEREAIIRENLPEQPINISDIQNKYDEAIDNNRTIQDGITDHKAYKIRIENNVDTIKALQGQIEELNREIIELSKKGQKIAVWLDENPVIDLDGIRQEMSDITNTNEQIGSRERNKEADIKQKAAQETYKNYTQELKDRMDEVEEGLKKNWNKIPDQKLSLTETGIAYNGTPYSQVAYSERLKIAIKISMALNPDLKVIRIADYSLLDKESKETVSKMSDDENYQVWAETVGKEEVGFYINEAGEEKVIEVGYHLEAGEIKTKDGKEYITPGPIDRGEGFKGKKKTNKVSKYYESMPMQEE